jgi:hypothetical protein
MDMSISKKRSISQLEPFERPSFVIACTKYDHFYIEKYDKILISYALKMLSSFAPMG